MTALELREGLLKTGTAEAKLKSIDEMAARNPRASASEACAALEASGMNPITMAKAKHLAAGQPIADLMGVPPPQSDESKEKRLASEIAKALREQVVPLMQERVAEKSPGKLVKPTA